MLQQQHRRADRLERLPEVGRPPERRRRLGVMVGAEEGQVDVDLLGLLLLGGVRLGRVEDEPAECRHCMGASTVGADELQVDRLFDDRCKWVMALDGRAAPTRRIGAHGVRHKAEGVAARESSTCAHGDGSCTGRIAVLVHCACEPVCSA